MLTLAIISTVEFAKLTSVRIEVKETPNGNKGQAIVLGKDRAGKKIVSRINVGTGPGSGPSSGIVLDKGMIAVIPRHEFARFNDLVGIAVKNHHLVVDEELAVHLFEMILEKIRISTVPSNVRILSTRRGLLNLNFVTHEGRDGVKATFRIKDHKWTYVSGKYWRDPTWNGIRTF